MLYLRLPQTGPVLHSYILQSFIKLGPTRRDIAILKRISATLCNPLAAANDITWNILRYNRKPKIKCSIDIDFGKQKHSYLVSVMESHPNF